LIPLRTAWRYFDNKHKGKIVGFIMTGFGMSSLLFIYIAEYMINPDGDRPNDKGFYSEEIALRVKIISK
jgi:hypothetical protein